MEFAMDPFCFRQFDESSYSGSRLTGITKQEFIDRLNQLENAQLHDGYAPFCKHIFIENFTDATPGIVKITPDIRPLIEHGYVARRPEELAVLSRWVRREKLPPLKKAKYLDVILYSAEQCRAEAKAMGKTLAPLRKTGPEANFDWAVVAVKAQDVAAELPMAPITQLRNCLIEEGGSGHQIDRISYEASVAFWETHVELR